MWKREDIDSLEIENDHVLVKLERGNDEVVLNKGTLHETKIFIPINEGNQEVHAPVIGTVLKTPKRITEVGAPEWKTTCEVVPGDTVIMYYLSVVDALGGYKVGDDNKVTDDRVIVVGDDVYIFLKYDAIYCAVREDKLYPMNGWCFGKKIERPVYTQGSIVVGVDAGGERLENMRYYRQQVEVTHLSSKVEYIIGDYVEPDINVGDICFMDFPHRLAPLEVDMHSRHEKVYYFQRRHVIAVVDSPVEEKLHI